MGGNYDFFEIVLFACIAAFLVYRLRSVLGRRTGQEQSRGDNVERHEEENNDNVIALSNLEEGKNGAEGPKSTEAGIAQIKISDPSFDEERFTEGARAAFEMIINEVEQKKAAIILLSLEKHQANCWDKQWVL